MKKSLIWMLWLAVALSIFSMAEASGKRTKEPAQLTYHLVTERPLLAPWDAISFADNQPVMVAEEQSVQFLGSSGQVLVHLDRLKDTSIFLSERGNFIGVQDLSGPSEKPESPRSISFTLYYAQGGKLWSLKQPLGVDESLPSFYISNLGRVVMVEPLKAMLSFYDQAGSLAREVQLFPNTTAETERPVACTFSRDGNYFVVNALRQHARAGTELSPRETGQSFLVLFDARGEEIWRRGLEPEVSDRVAISPDGQMIAAGAYSTRSLDSVERATYLYNSQGKLLHSLNFPFRHAAFSSDGKYLFLGQKNHLHLVETQTGRVLWENVLPSQAGQVRALDLSSKGTLALVMAARSSYREDKFVYNSPQILIFADQGHQVWQEDFPEDSFLQPLARFQEDGSGILLAFQKRYLIYVQEK